MIPLNKAIVSGNLTKDPQLKSSLSGQFFAELTVATNRTYRSQTGVKKNIADYHTVMIFGKLAETIHRDLKRGNGVYIEGRMETQRWKENDEQKNRTVIIARDVLYGEPARKTTQKV